MKTSLKIVVAISMVAALGGTHAAKPAPESAGATPAPVVQALEKHSTRCPGNKSDFSACPSGSAIVFNGGDISSLYALTGYIAVECDLRYNVAVFPRQGSSDAPWAVCVKR
jgi:hypothetical protein